jgi:uncharacterized protein (TIGR02246 family)
MSRLSPILSALTALLLTACTPAPAPDNRAAEALALRDGEVAAFIQDWAGKDAARMAAHFTEDGNLMIPNSPTMTGRDAIANGMKQALADPNWSLVLQPVQVDVSKAADLAYTRGAYILTATDPATKKRVTERGRFLIMFRKGPDGSWKAVQDITNPEATASSK